MNVLRLDELHSSLSDPALTSMNFLNEVANRFPGAISFAPGRPYEESFDLDSLHRYLRVFAAHLADERGLDERQVNRLLFQYGRTKGIIHDLIARHLEVDEGMVVDPESIVVTVGCQEALLLTLRALRRDARDTVLAVAPTYVGLTGAARLLDMAVRPVDGDSPSSGSLAAAISSAIAEVRVAGARPRALYVVPDFSNPSGVTLSLDERHELLAVAERENLLLLEDNPYGLFRATGSRLPTLKALDTKARVVYLGSLAKTCFPGARVGFAVADQRVESAGLFADELSKIKSMITVNTSPVSQAVAGGKLLEHGCSLARANAREISVYRRNLTTLLAGLSRRFGPAGAVSWNQPGGGFFVVLTVPFPVTDALLEHSAAKHEVLWTPMSHFYDGSGGQRQLRLSCSLLTPEEIELGLDRLAALFEEAMA